MHTLTNPIKKLKILTALVFATCFANAQQPGDLDPTFTSGIEELYGVKSIAIQPNGKIILGGSLMTYSGENRLGIARINADGTLDPSFNPGAGPVGPFADGSINSVALQPYGKILIGGYFFEYNNVPRNGIARINPDGSLDTEFFNSGEGALGIVYSIVVQPNGQILIGGNFSHYNGVTRNRIARLRSTGSLDPTFNPGIGVGDPENTGNAIRSIALHPDGSIFIVGEFPSYNGISRNNIAKLNPDGSLDTSFNIGTGTNNIINICAVQSDGKLLIGGEFTQYNNIQSNSLIRLNEDGSLDTTFNIEAYKVKAITLQADGKILVGGDFIFDEGYTTTVIRLNNDGSIDTTFNLGAGAIGTAETGINSIVRHNDKMYIGGYFTSYNNQNINSIISMHKEPCNVSPPQGPTEQTYVIPYDPVELPEQIPLSTLDITGENLTWYVSQEDLENGVTTPDHSNIESGTTYYVTQTIDGCVSEPHAITVTIILGTEEFSGKSNLVYFPNPVKDYLSISSPEPITKVQIFTIYGTLLKEETWNMEKGTLNMENLNSGSYIVNIKTDKANKKIIVIRS